MAFASDQPFSDVNHYWFSFGGVTPLMWQGAI